MARIRISTAVCAVVGDLFSNAGSHATLDALFEAVGAPGPPPQAAHHSKWKTRLIRTANDPEVDALAVFGALLSEFMDLPPDDPDPDSREAWQSQRERERCKTDVLARRAISCFAHQSARPHLLSPPGWQDDRLCRGPPRQTADSNRNDLPNLLLWWSEDWGLIAGTTTMTDSYFRTTPSRRDLLRGRRVDAARRVAFRFASAGSGRQQPRKPKNCILLWMLGGPSHIDMYDLKPDAPAEIRGELHPIQTRLRGVELGELMPKLAACNDKFSLIRSMHSYTASHGMGDHHLLSGRRYSKDFMPPSFGAVLAWQQASDNRGGVPPFAQIGDMKSTNFGRQGKAGALGRNYDPFLVDRDPNSSSFRVEAFSTPDSVGIERLTDRQDLLSAVDRFQAGAERQLRVAATKDAFDEQAFDLLTSQKAKQAFDIQQEPERLRDAYGRNRVGQGLLLARRLNRIRRPVCDCQRIRAVRLGSSPRSLPALAHRSSALRSGVLGAVERS